MLVNTNLLIVSFYTFFRDIHKNSLFFLWKIKTLNLDENELGVAVGIQEGNTELKDKINAALAKLTDEQRLEMMNGALDRAPGE